MLKTLDKSAVSYQIVLTKADQVKTGRTRSSASTQTSAALAKHPAAFPEVLVTSSRTGAGMPELRAAMVRLLQRAQLMTARVPHPDRAGRHDGRRRRHAGGGVRASAPTPRGWPRRRRCCCFMRRAVLGAVALAERGVIHAPHRARGRLRLRRRRALFAGDLTLRQYAGHGAVSDGRADRRHAADRRAGWCWRSRRSGRARAEAARCHRSR